MKKLRSFCLLLVCFLLLQILYIPTFADEQPQISVTEGCATLDAQVPLMDKQVLETAKGVILYERNTDTLIHSWNPDEKVDPSGMNKIMTALLALEHGDTAAVVTASKEALNSVERGAVSAGLKAGEQMPLLDLLYCMMVGSANDAAAVIAEHIGGSQAAFVTMMNEKATELGCTNTLFMNANGLSHESQYTTARDLAKITAAALELDVFVELFSAPGYTVAATNVSPERQLLTTNRLMTQTGNGSHYDERVTGGKTGALSTTDRSLISTAKNEESSLLCVVMSAKGTVTANGLSVKTYGSFEETRELLDYAFTTYSMRQLLSENRVMGQFAVANGENDVIGRPGEAVVSMMPVNFEQESVTYRCTLPEGVLSAPIKEGQTIGTVEMWFEEICVGKCDLVAMHNVGELGKHNVSISQRAEEAGKDAWITWLLIGCLIVLALVLLLGLYLLATWIIRKTKLDRWYLIRRKHKKRRR